MRIGVDMLADQSAGRLRGTGRYVRGLLRELLASGDHDFFLYYYDGLPRNDVPATKGRLTLRSLAGEGSLHSRIDRVAHDNADRLDWLLLTCPLENFQGYLPPFVMRRGPRLAAIIYDLIPLRFPDHYLTHRGIAAAYRRALAAVRNYDLLLTISQSARQDMLDLLHVSPSRVVTIGAASDSELFQPPSSRGDPQSIAWLTRHGIHKPFVYAVTAPDYRKNLSGLLAAWRCLPERIRDGYQCVITCATNSAESASTLRDMVTGSPDCKNVVFTEALDDGSLRRLYQQAAAFVFPSRYEGFGLPLLEAMQCGSAVIAGDNSSQVEVLGDAGLLANVDDPRQLSERIARLLDRPELADELRARAVRQAKQFSWPQVASRCLAALADSSAAAGRANWLRAWTTRGRLAIANRFEADARQMRGVRS
jgi:glycosyltransferase involved in cell wall biosynthesis